MYKKRIAKDVARPTKVKNMFEERYDESSNSSRYRQERRWLEQRKKGGALGIVTLEGMKPTYRVPVGAAQRFAWVKIATGYG